jgi:hypothetical protein
MFLETAPAKKSENFPKKFGKLLDLSNERVSIRPLSSKMRTREAELIARLVLKDVASRRPSKRSLRNLHRG